jgi:hypothetical protein
VQRISRKGTERAEGEAEHKKSHYILALKHIAGNLLTLPYKKLKKGGKKMRRLFVASLIVLVGIAAICASIWSMKENGDQYSPAAVKKAEVQSSAFVKTEPDFGKIPLYFIPNQGQVNEKVRFYAKTSMYTLWMTKDGLVFDSIKKVKAEVEKGTTHPAPLGHPSQEKHTPPFGHPSQEGSKGLPHSPDSPKIERDVSRLLFQGANKNPLMVPVELTQHQANYFKGKDPSQWQAGIRTAKAVLYKDIYPYIDLKVYGVERQLEYDWVVNPGGDPGKIKFEYLNVKATIINKHGDLIIKTQFGELVHKKPVSYQVIDGNKVRVGSNFKKIGKKAYGFTVEEYVKNCELIIDPAVVTLKYSTYLGGSGDDIGKGITVDKAGYIYITGSKDSLDFPTKNAYQGTCSGNLDVFVTKLKRDGSGLIFSTFLGGSSTEEGNDCAVTPYGYLYVVGNTNSSDFPAWNSWGGANDAFVCTLDYNGDLIYSWFLGGKNHEFGSGVALDNIDNAYVVGRTNSPDFPLLGSYQNKLPGGYDIFICKVHYETGLIFSTYFGGSKTDRGLSITVSKSGYCCVTGDTSSRNFPTRNACQRAFAGGETDSFVSMLKADRLDLVYSTYLGGSGNDTGWGIAVNDLGFVYVSGETSSVDFPTKNAFQAAISGNRDAFVSKFNPNPSTLVFSTYLGGSGCEVANGLAVDVSGNAYVSGFTDSNDFPMQNASFGGSGNVFVTKFFANGLSLAYSTYFGGAMADYNSDIAVDTSNSAFVTGFTRSKNFPLERPYQGSFGGGSYDAFVSKLSIIYDVDDLLNLTVRSTPDTGILIKVAPHDFNGREDGYTNFPRQYLPGTLVTLTAPGNFNNKTFSKWEIDDDVDFSRTTWVLMDSHHTVRAVYQASSTRTLVVQSTPDIKVPIHVTPTDINKKRNGQTNFSRTYNVGDKVWLMAPGAFKGKKFYKWSIDGVDFFSRKIVVTMNADHIVTAQYKRK